MGNKIPLLDAVHIVHGGYGILARSDNFYISCVCVLSDIALVVLQGRDRSFFFGLGLLALVPILSLVCLMKTSPRSNLCLFGHWFGFDLTLRLQNKRDPFDETFLVDDAGCNRLSIAVYQSVDAESQTSAEKGSRNDFLFLPGITYTITRVNEYVFGRLRKIDICNVPFYDHDISNNHRRGDH